jgi:hypothetical protein
MKTRELLVKIINLILESEDATSDWINVSSLRRCFYGLVGGLFVFFVGLVLIPQTYYLNNLLGNSVAANQLYRCFMFLLSIAIIIIIMTTVYFYFRYILSQGQHIHLSNIITFYFVSVVFFGFSYLYFYVLFPNSFIFDSPPIVIQPAKIQPLPFAFTMQFFLFSAFQSVNGSYYRIHVNSAWASIITYVQSLFTIALIALLIASYVNQKIGKVRT